LQNGTKTQFWKVRTRWLDRLQERTRKFITIEFRAAPTTAPCATS